MEQSPPPFAPAPVATAPTGISASTVSSPPSMAQCLFSPSAPQVQAYALDADPISSNLEQATLMTDKQDGSVPHDVRPRTRSIARVERLVIPSSLDISDSEEEHGAARRTRPHKLLCPETVWSIPVSSRNQEGYWNGTPSHTFHPKQGLASNRTIRQLG
jgi:hypothetical protein